MRTLSAIFSASHGSASPAKQVVTVIDGGDEAPHAECDLGCAPQAGGAPQTVRPVRNRGSSLRPATFSFKPGRGRCSLPARRARYG